MPADPWKMSGHPYQGMLFHFLTIKRKHEILEDYIDSWQNNGISLYLMRSGRGRKWTWNNISDLCKLWKDFYADLESWKLYELEIDNTLWQILPSWYSDSKCFVSLAGVNSELYNNLKRWQRQKAQRLYVSCVYWLVWIIYTYELCTCTIGQLA